MEGKACSSGSTLQGCKPFRLGDAFETHMENFYKETSQRETMKKLTEALMMKLASSAPRGLINGDMKNHVEEALLKLAPLFHTPNHPDYALMIYTAIDELERSRGLTDEEAISRFIKEKFEDLPLAHDLMLKHYLKKLCENKEMVCGFGDCYTLAEEARRRWKRRQALWKGRSRERDIEAREQQSEVVENNEQQDQLSFEDDLDRPPGF